MSAQVVKALAIVALHNLAATRDMMTRWCRLLCVISTHDSNAALTAAMVNRAVTRLRSALLHTISCTLFAHPANACAKVF